MSFHAVRVASAFQCSNRAGPLILPSIRPTSVWGMMICTWSQRPFRKTRALIPPLVPFLRRTACLLALAGCGRGRGREEIDFGVYDDLVGGRLNALAPTRTCLSSHLCTP